MSVVSDFANIIQLGTGQSTATTQKTRDQFEVVLGISEGPIKGLHDDRKSFYIGDTPLQDGAGNELFLDDDGSNISLEVLPGDADPAAISFKLGGAASSKNVGVKLLQDVAVTDSTDTGDIDALEVRLVINALYVQNDDGTLGSNSATVLIEYKPHSSGVWLPFTTPSPFVLTGQFTSTNAVEFRLGVARLSAGDFYDIRVTKTSAESTTKSIADISWESFQQVVQSPMSFPNTAVAHLWGRQSNKFTGLPELKAIYDGMLLQIPSNYDPIARSYTGTWDGTFKTDWTNNPAWVLYNAIMNGRWGLNALYPCTIDKFDVYDAAQWCDGLVSDGQGGLQPRFTFDACITEAMNGKELITYIASSFNARIYDDLNGTLTIRVDKDADAVALFTPENITATGFTYSYSDLDQRYNDINVTFVNPDLNWQTDTVRVYDQDDIDAHGRVPLDLQAIGVTNRQLAARTGYYRLISALTEKEQVSFKTNRLGAQLQPFDVILVADPDMGYALSGRIKSLSADRKTAFLRDAIYLENGVHYDCDFETENGVLTASLTGSGTGNVTQLVFATALPAGIEALTTFSLGTGSSYGTPKPYRVMQIDIADTDEVTVTAMEINRLKWDAVDNTTFPGTVDYSDNHIGNFVIPPTNLNLTYQTLPDGTAAIHATWSPSTDKHLSHYRVDVSKNGLAAQFLTNSVSSDAWLNNAAGVYTFYVYAVNTLGFTSTVITATIDTSSATSSVPNITGLEIVGQGNDTVFTTKDVKFDWRVSTGQYMDIGDLPADATPPDPLFKDYVFQILDANTEETLYIDYTQNPAYNFTYDMNLAAGGPFRTFVVQVQYRDIQNRISAPAYLTVSNPAPDAVTNIQVTFGPALATITWPRTLEPDIQGYRVWLSRTEGFTPSDATLVYDGPNTQFQYADSSGDPIYIRVAAYDYYDDGTVNYSAEFAFVVPQITTEWLEQTIQDALAQVDSNTQSIASLQSSSGTVGTALNSDPAPNNISKWDATAGGTRAAASIVTLTDGKVGNTAIRSAVGAESDPFDNTYVPIDQTRVYRGYCWWRSSADANGHLYFAIDLRDADGARISGDGTFWHYIAAGVGPNTAWQNPSGTFGNGTSKPFPSNAVSMRVGLLMNYQGTAGYYEAQSIRLEDVTDITTTQASVTSEAVTRAGADTALGGRIDVVDSRVDDNDTSITELLASVNGIYAMWGVTINANGRVVGSVKLDGTASHTSFEVEADTFKVYQPGTSNTQPVFEVDATDHLIYLNAPLKLGSVDTGNLLAEAATAHGHSEVAGQVLASNTTTYFTLASVTKVVEGGNPVEIEATAMMFNADAGQHFTNFQITRSGTPIWPTSSSLNITMFGNTYNMVIAKFTDTPSAGTYTYAFQFKPASTAVSGYNIDMSVDEIKR